MAEMSTTADKIDRFIRRHRDHQSARTLEAVAVLIASADRVGEPADVTLAAVRQLIAAHYKWRKR